MTSQHSCMEVIAEAKLTTQTSARSDDGYQQDEFLGMADAAIQSQQRPLAETRSVSARSLASNMSIPVEPAGDVDCGASIAAITLGADSGFESGMLSGSTLSHLVTGRRDSSDGLIEAGMEQYLIGDNYTATLLLSEAAGQQTNHALDLEYGVEDWAAAISLDSQRIPSWMSGELTDDSSLVEVLNSRFKNASKMIEAVPSLDKNYLVCGSVCCLLNQWDEAREFYRQGLSACTEKNRLRAALGSLNGLERYVADTTERAEPEREPRKNRDAGSARSRSEVLAMTQSKSIAPGLRRSTFSSLPSRLESTTSAASTGSNRSRLHSFMRHLGYKRNHSSPVPEEGVLGQ